MWHKYLLVLLNTLLRVYVRKLFAWESVNPQNAHGLHSLHHIPIYSSLRVSKFCHLIADTVLIIKADIVLSMFIWLFWIRFHLWNWAKMADEISYVAALKALISWHGTESWGTTTELDVSNRSRWKTGTQTVKLDVALDTNGLSVWQS